MDRDRTYTAAEAAAVTGITQVMQLDWRKRAILPANDGKHSRFTLREVCWLRLLAELIGAGLPVGKSTPHLADEFLDSLMSMLRTVDRRATYDAMLAIIVQYGDGNYAYEMAFEVRRAAFLGKADFRNAIIINLAEVAADMARAMRDLEKD